MMEKEIVIKIEEETYNRIMNGWMPLHKAVNLMENIQKGTLLPEHHGRLIDENDLPKCCGSPEYDCYGECENCSDYVVYVDDIKKASTIIEGSDDNASS